MREPNFLVKVIPHADGTARICELIEYGLENIEVRGAWAGRVQISHRINLAIEVLGLRPKTFNCS
jgi:acetoacetate decarboxylase